MRVNDIRFLVAYDCWATGRILAVLDGIDEDLWSGANAISDRGLGGILVHQLGAAQRWRHGLSDSGLSPRPEREPLPTVEGLTLAWTAEWDSWRAWLDSLNDADLAATDEEIPTWQLLAHVMNHGTQHRSEAAVLLSAAGRSPGDLDMLDFAESLIAPGQARS